MLSAAWPWLTVAVVVLSVLGFAASREDARCGNPPGVPGVVSSVDVWHGRFVTEDSPGWVSLCGGGR